MSSARLIIGNYNYSSWSLRAWLVARASGLKFEVLRLPLDTPEFMRRIPEYSPSRCVPVLHHGGRVIWDSLAIAEYLAEQFPAAALWPADPATRAAARSVSAEMHAGFGALRQCMPMNCRATGRRVLATPALNSDIARIGEIWADALSSHGGQFLYGDFSIADAMYAPVVLRFETYGVEQRPELAAYGRRIIALRWMQEWVANARQEAETIAGEEVGIIKNS